MEYQTRNDFNKMLSSPQVQTLSMSAVLETSEKINIRQEQQQDINVARRRQRPDNYKIKIETQEEIKQFNKSHDIPRKTIHKQQQALTTTIDPVKKQYDELPEMVPKGQHVVRKSKHIEADIGEKIDIKQIIQKQKQTNIEFSHSTKENFTLSKLKQHRRDEQREANELQLANYVAKVGEQFQNQEQPFYLTDNQYSYQKDGKNISHKDLQNHIHRKHENHAIDEEKVRTICLKHAKCEKLEQQQQNAQYIDIQKIQEQGLIQKPKFSRTCGFSHQILTEKNPDWALLRVKSIMQQDEDKPMYSCFSPDGYFREMMLPQIRVQNDTAREIPQELRGMVRVMQLPIMGESANILNCDPEKIPGESRIMTRPEFFE